ncbi:toprim domain-containing protein (plasmid) [Sphingobium xenophagum]|nr:toprim domain-containing protein [Sphingobium xenophagum]
MPATIDAATRAKQIVESLGGRWSGSHGECRCPAHDDHSPSLSVRLGETAILFKCFAGCASTEVLKALDRQGLHDRSPVAVERRAPARDLSGLARSLWQNSSPTTGTLAETYLNARGLFAPSPELRFNAKTIVGKGKDRRSLPAMIAAVKNELGLVAVHRTFLDPSDVLHRPFRKPKLALGLLGTGSVRFGEPDDVLGLAEGIEDAMSAIDWFQLPVWAVLGAERYAHVAIPPHVRRVIVFGQRNAAAKICLERALEHLSSNDRLVEEWLPGQHDDWNDALRDRLARNAVPRTEFRVHSA